MHEFQINEHGAVSADGEILGWVRYEQNTHPDANVIGNAWVTLGYHWFAIPRSDSTTGIYKTLSQNHFKTRDEATAAVVGCTGLDGHHKDSCQVWTDRNDLARQIVEGPASTWHHGAWVEYFNDGDQEIDLCSCGTYEV